MAGKPDPLIVEARERWTRCDEAEQDQRKRMLLAKQFRAGDQWPDAIKIQRQGGQAISGQAAQPPRPCLTIDRLSQPCRQVSNTIKSANFAIDVMPNGNGADTETADVLKGYLRYVQNRARGESPVEWAADGAIEAGLGWFRIRSEYVHESADGVPPEELGDQELRLERITNNLSVYCDPWSTKPTRSDARFMFVTEDLSRDEFKRRWPKADFASLEALASTGDPVAKSWVGTDTVRIAEYWRVEFAEQQVTLPTGTKRTIRTPRVKMSLINAAQELETFDWAGTRIPLIPVMGEELNVDGKAHLRGIIEEGMDAQRMVNYTYSGAVEVFALAPKAPFIVAEGQIDDYKTLWQTANTANYPYLPYKPTSLNGTPVPPPARNQAEPPIQAAALLLQVSEEAIRATTGIHEPSLGSQTDKARSGRAIQALQGQSDLGTSNYPDNVRRALIYAGELMVEIIPKITRPGQLLQILGVDDAPKQVIIGQPFIEGEKGQSPQPVTPEQAEAARLQKGMVKLYDVTKGRYAVTVAVGKSYTTKREEGAAALGELIPGLPPPMQAAIAPEFIEELSFPGAHKIAEVARRALPPELQAPPDGEEAIPPRAQQMLAQAQQAIQALTQQNEQLSEMVKTDAVKVNGALQQKQIQESSESERTAAELASKERIESMKFQLELRKLEVELEIEMAKLGSAQSMARAEVEQQDLHHHDEMLQREQEREEASAQQTLDRQAAQEQAQMQAASKQESANA